MLNGSTFAGDYKGGIPLGKMAFGQLFYIQYKNRTVQMQSCRSKKSKSASLLPFVAFPFKFLIPTIHLQVTKETFPPHNLTKFRFLLP